jgi:hypothetical protein
MKNNFTPDPWKLHSIDMNGYNDITVFSKDGKCLADISDYENAKLISSAPELYEALKLAE